MENRKKHSSFKLARNATSSAMASALGVVSDIKTRSMSLIEPDVNQEGVSEPTTPKTQDDPFEEPSVYYYLLYLIQICIFRILIDKKFYFLFINSMTQYLMLRPYEFDIIFSIFEFFKTIKIFKKDKALIFKYKKNKQKAT